MPANYKMNFISKSNKLTYNIHSDNINNTFKYTPTPITSPPPSIRGIASAWIGVANLTSLKC